MAAHAELPEVLADPEALEAVRAIYETSFRPEERTSLEALARDPRRRMFVTRAGAEGPVVGFAITRSLAPAGAHLLEYLAVEEASRDGGVGGALLDEVIGSLRGSCAWLLIEVDDPEAASSEPDRRLRERRIGFYERHGARLARCARGAYRAPRTDRTGEVRYLLLWAPLADGVDEPRGEALRDAVRVLLADVYELGAEAPLVREVLEALAC